MLHFLFKQYVVINRDVRIIFWLPYAFWTFLKFQQKNCLSFSSKFKENCLPLNMDILTPSYRSGQRSAPMAILCSLILDLSACFSSGWLLGHFGDVVVLKLSPSACCSLKCLRCQNSKPFFSCSGNSQLSSLESNESSLDVYALSNHLQYWTIAFLGLGFLSCSLFICDDVSRLLKVRDKEKTSLTMIKVAVITCLAASMLSSIVQAIITYESLDPKRLSSSFGDLNTPTSAALEVGDLVVTFGWPYYARCISILLICCVALPLVISKLCSRKSLVLLMATKNPHAGFSSDNECEARSVGVAVCRNKRGSTDPLSSTSHSSTSPRSNSSVVSSLVGAERIEPFLVLAPRNRDGDVNAGRSIEAKIECCLDESLGATYGQLAVTLSGEGGSHLVAGRALEQYRAIVCYESACGDSVDCSQRFFNNSLTKCSCSDQGGPSEPHDLKLVAEGQKFNRLTSAVSHVRSDCTKHDDRFISADQYDASSKSFTRAMRKQLPVSNGPSTSTAPNPAPPLKVNGVKFTQIYDSHEMMSLEDNDVTLVNE